MFGKSWAGVWFMIVLIVHSSRAAFVRVSDDELRQQREQDDAETRLSGSTAASGGPYFLLEPSSFAVPLGDDLDWATQNIPLFESSNSTLDLVYYFRWRTYKSHIHPVSWC